MKRGQILPKFRCPICHQRVASHVINSRKGKRFYWRRRECLVCHETFTTKEVVAALPQPARNI